MAEITKLKQQRSQIKAQMTRIQTFLYDNTQISVADAQVKLEKLESLWKSFKKIQKEIEDKTPEAEDAAALFLADQDAERQLFEIRYHELIARMKTIIEDEDAESQEEEIQADNDAQIIIHERRNKPKLSDIKLTDFNGEFTKWLSFKNSFETTIHNDVELTNIQKHQYLIGVLKGEARKVIEGFTISDENYENAWELLKSTYDNEMMLIETHLEELMKFPSISKEDKEESIRYLVWHIQTHVSSLKTLSQPIDYWDTLIIHLAKKKLDFAEQNDWQNSVKGRTSQNMPRLEEFITFLIQRCDTLRMLNQNKEKQLAQRGERKMDQKNQKKKSRLE